MSHVELCNHTQVALGVCCASIVGRAQFDSDLRIAKVLTYCPEIHSVESPSHYYTAKQSLGKLFQWIRREKDLHALTSMHCCSTFVIERMMSARYQLPPVLLRICSMMKQKPVSSYFHFGYCLAQCWNHLSLVISNIWVKGGVGWGWVGIKMTSYEADIIWQKAMHFMGKQRTWLKVTRTFPLPNADCRVLPSTNIAPGFALPIFFKQFQDLLDCN